MKLISWNVAHRDEAWRALLDSDADVALLQEAAPPPADLAGRFEISPGPWLTAGTTRPWRAAVVNVSRHFEVRFLEPATLDEARAGDLAVSRLGTLAAASISPSRAEPVLVISMYGLWERARADAGSGWIFADASVHRLISDISLLIGREKGHRIIAAGDLNILYGYGEQGSPYWASRYATVFDRMSALGLEVVGPQSPCGRQADPWPQELPPDSQNVPTYHTNRQTPATAARQLDFVFASSGLDVRASALNATDGWGPSDHCRIEIDVRAE